MAKRVLVNVPMPGLSADGDNLYFRASWVAFGGEGGQFRDTTTVSVPVGPPATMLAALKTTVAAEVQTAVRTSFPAATIEPDDLTVWPPW